jgi:hypothetical protein
MLGFTTGNLENERTFFRHCLVHYGPGDLLLLDIQLVHAPADQPDEIRRKDPTLRNGLRHGHIAFLSGPVRRYVEGVTDVQIKLELDTNGPVRGSYSLEVVAKVKLTGRREKCFFLHRYKRYDAKRLAEFMRELGWELIADLRYGAELPPTKALLLFRRGHDSPAAGG